MKTLPLILPALNGFVWGGLVWIGHDLAKGVESRVACSSLSQIDYYIVLPLVALIVSLVPSMLLSQTKWAVFGNIWSGLTLLLVVPYLLPYSGGV